MNLFDQNLSGIIQMRTIPSAMTRLILFASFFNKLKMQLFLASASSTVYNLSSMKSQIVDISFLMNESRQALYAKESFKFSKILVILLSKVINARDSDVF